MRMKIPRFFSPQLIALVMNTDLMAVLGHGVRTILVVLSLIGLKNNNTMKNAHK